MKSEVFISIELLQGKKNDIKCRTFLTLYNQIYSMSCLSGKKILELPYFNEIAPCVSTSDKISKEYEQVTSRTLYI